MRRAAIFASLILAGCNMPALNIPPAQQDQLNAALAATCPWMVLHPLLPIQWPPGVQTAFLVMQHACPPNSPPTTLWEIAAVIKAAVTLKPYVR